MKIEEFAPGEALSTQEKSAAQTQENPPLNSLQLYQLYGVPMRRSKANPEVVQAHLQRNGEDVVLFEVPRDDAGMRQARQNLETLRVDQQRLLEQRFQVSFSKSGEVVGRQIVQQADGSVKKGDAIHARLPRLNELYGIQAALERSAPAQLLSDHRGIKFTFTDNTFVKDVPDRTLAHYVANDQSGKPGIAIHPVNGLGILVGDVDVRRFGLPQHEDSMEMLLSAELAQHSLHRLKLDRTKDVRKIAESLGWHLSEKGHWSLEHQNGNSYRLDTETDQWVRVNQKEQLLDAGGNVVADVSAAEKMSANEMQAGARVHPATGFIESPQIELADALALYRLNERERIQLEQTSPQLYQTVKQLDQQDIDLSYGKAHGQSRFVRNSDGRIVQNK